MIDGIHVSAGRREESAAGAILRQPANDAGRRQGISANLAPVCVSAGGYAAPGKVHTGDHAWAGADWPRSAGADRGLYVVPERLPVLTAGPRRGRGGITGKCGTGVERVARSGEFTPG